jgi:PAS domain S-box-containing protein
LFRYRLFDVVPLAWDNVVENMSDAVIVLDAQDRVVNLNPIARGMASLADKEVIGQPTAQVFAAWPGIVATYQNVKETHTEIEVDTTIGLRSVELRIQPLYDPRQRFKGRVVIVRDITKQKQTEAELRKHRDNLEELVAERTAELSLANQQLQQQIIEREQLEAQLRQSQKLEALGRLAGGIAHDFNNLLVPILSYAELSLLHLAPDNKLHTYLVEVKKAAQRAANLVKHMLAFSRQQILDVEVLDLNVIIDEFKLILQSLLGENIELHILISDSLHPLKADKGQMEQVLMNLVINSRDAMPDGGKITIETANIFLDESYVTQYASDLAPGPYVMLAISDTGEGMDTETQAHIFDPFFTTKEVGKGTGLGLATVFGIIKQHRGHLWVDSEPGQGTIFKVYLPHAEANP